MIYRRTYHNSKYIDPHPDLDWAANLSYMMGKRGGGAALSLPLQPCAVLQNHLAQLPLFGGGGEMDGCPRVCACPCLPATCKPGLPWRAPAC